MRVPLSCKVYTPRPVASAIVSAIRDEPSDLWLEPCSGKGAFLEALEQIGVPPERIVAVDLDAKSCKADVLATTYRGTEFLEWSLSCNQRFSRIVGNPPFVSLRRLHSQFQSIASRINCDWAGSSNGNSNLWFAFLRASLSMLKKGGSFGFIVPAAFDYADYAATLRATIHEHFAEFEVHRCQRPLFKEVQDGCVVLIGRGYELQHRGSKRYVYGSPAELVSEFGRDVHRRAIATVSKDIDAGRTNVRLGEVMKITIGCVTGDASYFLLRESERLDLKLPLRVLRPMLTRTRQLRTAFVTEAYWDTLREGNERVWLFRPESRQTRLPAVRRYLRLDPEKGGCNRTNFKVKVRPHWYKPDVPTEIDGFVSGTSQFGPWISLNSCATISATNTLYCVKFVKAQCRDECAAWALSLFTSEFREQYLQKTRSYPDGLAKIEPGDLAALRLVRPPKDCSGAAQKYQEVVSTMLKSGRLAAEAMVRRWFRARGM